MRVGITGASGFIGSALATALRSRGDAVRALVRDPGSVQRQDGVEAIRFDVNDPTPNAAALEGLDAIVHLAGETVDGRWTPAKKRAIFDSRVAGTRNLVAALAALERRPKALICASASGYYGDRGDEVLDDDSPPGRDFLAGVCVAWEREANAAAKLDVRVAALRTGVVFGHGGGALAKMRPIFQFGLGGPLGSGRQWMPWIHLDDLTAMYLFALDREELTGPIAAVSPDWATNGRVMQAVGHAMRRPALAPAPGFALKIVLGEFADSLLGGQLIVPRKAADAGFVWRHADLEAAVIHAIDPTSTRMSAIQTFRSEQFIKAPMEAVTAFFGDGRCLARLTPPAMHLQAPAEPVQMRRGAIIDYRMRVWGMALRWRALIVEWRPGVRFTDVQVRGPYLWWRHTHEFERKDSGVVVRDMIAYELPLAPLSDFALPAVRRDVEKAFAFRRRAIEEIFSA